MGSLIGMHHLTSIGCSVATDDHVSSQLISGPTLVAEIVHADVVQDAEGIPTPGITCLALIASVVILRAGRKFRLLRRRASATFDTTRRAKRRSELPPDLHALSISRT